MTLNFGFIARSRIGRFRKVTDGRVRPASKNSEMHDQELRRDFRCDVWKPARATVCAGSHSEGPCVGSLSSCCG